MSTIYSDNETEKLNMASRICNVVLCVAVGVEVVAIMVGVLFILGL